MVIDGIDCIDASSALGIDSLDIRCAVSKGDADGCAEDSSVGFCSSMLVLGGSDGGLDACLSGTAGGFESSPSIGELGGSPLVSWASSNFYVVSATCCSVKFAVAVGRLPLHALCFPHSMVRYPF